MPVPLPLVAMDRASGSVSEICWSGAAPIVLSSVCSSCMSRFKPAIFSCSRSDLGRGGPGLLPVSRFERGHVAGDALFDLLDPKPQLGWREALVARVHRLELAAVDRDQAVGEQVQLAAQQDELAAGGLDGGTVVAAEVGDGLEVRREAPGQPDHLEVALRLTLQAPAGGHAVEIAVDVELQQRGWMVAGAAGVGGRGAAEPSLARSR